MNRLNRQTGFTLIEVMVVVVILAILAAYVVPRVTDKPEEARIARTKQDIAALETALELYKMDNFTYPSTDQGLDALVKKPSGSPEPKRYNPKGYLKSLPSDPWGNPYQYLSPGVKGDVDVFSFGPDGQSSDDDIGNWNISK